MQRGVALIGLGQMGLAIGRRLLATGFAVTAYNRTPSRCEPLVALGAQIAGSIEEAARSADTIITCLRGSDAEVAAVDRFLPAMKTGALHIATSTLPPETGARHAAAHQARGTRYLSAPMQGRPEAAAQGQLTLWASGARDAFDAAEPVLAAIARDAPWLGPLPEQGLAAKLAVNMLLFGNVELLAEAGNYMKRCGIQPEAVFGPLTETAFATPLFRAIVADLAGDHASTGTNLAGSLTDLRLLAEHAKSIDAALPAADAVRDQYERAVGQGHALKSQGAVLRTLSPLANGA
jgi:3-hydroxyisobutyrate dehydrogenase-like beta-hydroxyacid dehydrogenase